MKIDENRLTSLLHGTYRELGVEGVMELNPQSAFRSMAKHILTQVDIYEKHETSDPGGLGGPVFRSSRD